jgi:hypothetical protein
MGVIIDVFSGEASAGTTFCFIATVVIGVVLGLRAGRKRGGSDE